LDQTFQADRTTYTASVDATQESITLIPVAADDGATIRVDEIEVASGSTSSSIALAVGQNLIEIEVTAADGSTTTTYTLEVYRSDSTIPSSDASLSGLTLSGATLDQLFQPSQTDYIASANFLVTSVTLTPVAADDGATIWVNGIEVASGSASAAIALAEWQTLISLEVAAEDGVTTETYSITLVQEPADRFAQQAYLKASNAEENDEFGWSVALSGDTLVVGAWQEDSSASGGEADNSAPGAGAVYVFIRNGGAWSQQAYLKASNAEAGDIFGSSVAISGDTLVVGAIGSAAAYVFTRSSGVWSQQAYLKASNAEADDMFGWSVAISGDTLVVGACEEESSASGGENDNSARYTGAAYVFTRSSGVWSQQAYLKASNAEAWDYFGWSVALSGDTLVVGAPYDPYELNIGSEDEGDNSAGAVYVFTRSGGVWSQQAYLKASNAEAGDWFGWRVAISGGTLVVGACAEDSSASGGEADNSAAWAGAAYVWR
jgi:hypothetical protein